MPEYIMQIDFIDSPGLGYEIFKITDKNKINKIAMEVLPKIGMALQFECEMQEQIQQLMTDLSALPSIKSIQFLNQMPYREKEQELGTILNSVSEGIIAINLKGCISHINEVACKLFGCNATVIGLPVETVLGPHSLIKKTLDSGKVYRLQEQKLEIQGKKFSFFTSTLPVTNDLNEIIGAVSTIQDLKQVEKALLNTEQGSRQTTFDAIICQSARMNQVITAAKTVAKSTSTVLLRGESGTGKELFAAAIHQASQRATQRLLAINCTALTDTLLESELFGYEAGAFTGAAKQGKKGLFEQANGGTLFLDEIGDISPRLQVQLLRVLQTSTIRPVGGSREIEVDVRIIAATHRNLEELIRCGQFREDLYYRLNVIPLTLPPLRDRKEDIPLLAQHLVKKICQKLNKPPLQLTPASVALLLKKSWPGNVRQLENTLERIINFIDGREIQPQDIAAWSDLDSAAFRPETVSRQEDSLAIQIPLSPTRPWPTLKEIVTAVEKEILAAVLEQYPSSRAAGQALGVSNTTILNKIHAYQLQKHSHQN